MSNIIKIREENQIHERYMRMALSLAMRGTGSVSPNPRVGCVIVNYEHVSQGRVIGLGYHTKYGAPHAEVEALRATGEGACGCTAYVTLEPCCHTGKTPPCSDALIRAGVSRVVIGASDPNPLVSGGGATSLEAAGVEVVTGVLEDECKWINRGFIRSMTIGRPWVTVKAAMSLDGRMALAGGESMWISGEDSRRRAHLMRAEHDAVMVGVGTVLKDDPQLTVRMTEGKSPLKVIVDRDLRTPPDARILDEGECVFFSGVSPDGAKAEALSARGASVIKASREIDGYVPMEDILRELRKLGVNTLMAEGGAKVIGSLIKDGLADGCSFFIAPSLLGNGVSMSDELSFSDMSCIISVKRGKFRKIGDDILFEGMLSCSPGL